MQRHVSKKGLQMRAADVAWAWVAQKARDGQAVGRVFRPAIGKLVQHEDHVLWQLVAQAITGWDVTVREKIAKETLWRVVLSRQVLVSAYRVTDRDTTVRRGIAVEEVQDMKLAPVMTPMLAAKVWQNTSRTRTSLQGWWGEEWGG